MGAISPSQNQYYPFEHQPTYQEEVTNDEVTILFNRVQNGMKHGPAIAIFHEYTIRYLYDLDIKQGPALIAYPDGTLTYFNYLNDLSHGPARAVFPDGTSANFRYEHGVAMANIDQE